MDGQATGTLGRTRATPAVARRFVQHCYALTREAKRLLPHCPGCSASCGSLPGPQPRPISRRRLRVRDKTLLSGPRVGIPGTLPLPQELGEVAGIAIALIPPE